ncbi:MAG: hypothetical protein ACRC7O_10495, partial [Fimbriiglobus sp.]
GNRSRGATRWRSVPKLPPLPAGREKNSAIPGGNSVAAAEPVARISHVLFAGSRPPSQREDAAAQAVRLAATLLAPKGWAMEKWLCLGAMGVGGLMAVVFILDVAIGMPFGGSAFMVGDILGIVAGLIVVYLGFNAKRDLK